jgi:predicted GIY-YIG superfamily endonuclease
LVAKFEVSEKRGEAVKVEKYLKKMKDRNFIEKVIEKQNTKSG